MKKYIIVSLLGICSVFGMFAQQTVKGKIVNSETEKAMADVMISIVGTSLSQKTVTNGTFVLKNVPNGNQIVKIQSSGFETQQFPVKISDKTIDLGEISLFEDFAEEIDQSTISLSDDELDQGDDNGGADNVAGLLSSGRTVFQRAAAFDFSATFFRPRGLGSENGKVLINGIEMNKQFNGRPQWSDWGGINDAQRNRVFSEGISASEYTFGGIAGTTNIIMRASEYRKGGQISYANSNRSYTGRVLASYNSGLLANNWAYSITIGRRYGDEGYKDGTSYNANSIALSVEKKLNDKHSLNFTSFYTPNRRGRATSITQEAKDLKGIKYNPNWGKQAGKNRNSRLREIEEPVFMLNHFWNINKKTTLNTNVAYQFGTIGNTRIDNGGTRLSVVNGQETFPGGARNPFGNYYQRLPSYALRFPNPTPGDFQEAFTSEREFIRNGQVNWSDFYEANQNSENSIYVLQEDINEDTSITFNTILNSALTDNITLNANFSYNTLKSENYAEINDLLGGTGYLDVDFFAEEGSDTTVGDIAQSDLLNRNRIVGEGDRYKYNFEIDSNVMSAFAQAQFNYNKVDFFLGANLTNTTYQRTGLYQNGSFLNNSLGKSEEVDFTTYGVKGGATYKLSGRHLINFNAAYLTKAPTIRNTFNNSRQNNNIIVGLEAEAIKSADISYILRSPKVKAKITGFYSYTEDATDIGFFFTENLSGQGFGEGNAFVQQVLTNIEKENMGLELGIEYQIVPTLNLKAAASLGQYTYANNPNLYLTSDDFDGALTFGDGTTKLENYHLGSGPETAVQFGLEYRDPTFWNVGLTTNYYNNAYIGVSQLNRSANFTSDFDGLPFNDYDEDIARDLLKQEKFDSYVLVNIVGGKSWRVNGNTFGFFATINNVLDKEYKTGGFEQSRNSNYRNLLEDKSREYGEVFGNRYFFGNGTTYFVNLYYRF